MSALAKPNNKCGCACLRIAWEDGQEAGFHHVWLRDHDPATLHPTSLQREVDAAALDVEALASTMCKTSLLDGGDTLAVDWPDGERSSFGAEWLRRHCYESWALSERAVRRPTESVTTGGRQSLWGASDLVLPRVRCADVLSSDAGEQRRAVDELVIGLERPAFAQRTPRNTAPLGGELVRES